MKLFSGLWFLISLLPGVASVQKKISFSDNHEITSPGGVLYDAYTEMCCNGVVHSVPALASSQYCCGNNTFNYRTNICCWRPGPVVKERDFGEHTACCGSATYDRRKETCCRITMRRAPIPAWVASNETSLYRCCTNVAYDVRTQICCNGRAQTKWSPYSSCCGNDQIDRRSSACCSNAVVSNKGLDSQAECCGGQVHDVGTQICCSGNTTIPIERGLTACCGTRGYNKVLELCCGNKVIPRKSYTPNHKCCGTNAYDSSKALCCSGNIVKKRSFRSACCGKQVHEMDLQMCCDTTLHKRKNMFMRCCGSDSYDLRRELCCGGKVMKNGKDNKRHCCTSDLISHFHHHVECKIKGEDFPSDDEDY